MKFIQNILVSIILIITIPIIVFIALIWFIISDVLKLKKYD